MAIVSESVIVQDPDIHSGEPVFRGTAGGDPEQLVLTLGGGGWRSFGSWF